MSALSLRLPESLHRKVRELAEREDISINQFIATAVAEKMSALLTLEYLEERASRGSRAHFRSILRRVPDVPPLPGDEWPPASEAASNQRLQPSKARRGTKARKGKK
ncbi:MAG: toxin-antitoxin system HicB family antitoxin [Gemmatimonadetes bacterium]|nr:toxin-antitoxin system HicB family antitoxin [Gemmatimonadota bacterium]MBI2403640.1 toxin-antitoxin system HicB family antitoxin [Gemmatimonadota bacterium]